MTHWLEVNKETTEIIRFFVDDIRIPSYDDDHILVVVPVESEDMIDTHIINGQLYDFQTGKVIDSDLSWNFKLEQQLIQTDWLVTRHRDEIDLGVETKLSESEYKDLLQFRQDLRKQSR